MSGFNRRDETGVPINRRNYYRLRLPMNEFLQVWIEGLIFEICEIAERSFVITDSRVPHRSGVCRGVIQWGDGKQSRFSGRIGPDLDGRRLVMDVEGIQTGHIVAEQRRLRQRYPDRAE